MDSGGVRSAVEVLTGTELSVADHGELAVAASAVARLQSFVDLAKVQIARRGRQLAVAGDTSSNHVLIDEGRCTGADTAATNGRDRVCGELSGFESALTAGEVTGAHLDALARHTKDLTDTERSDLAAIATELVADAMTQPAGLFDRTVKERIDTIRNQHRPGTDVEQLEQQRRLSKVKRWTERDTGMRNTLISLDPLRDESLWNIINAHLATLRHDHTNARRPFAELQIDAVLAAVSASVSASPGGVVRVPEIVIHTDGHTLCHGRHATTMCETADGAPVPVSTMHRLCCEAVLHAVIANPDGTIDQLCREQRSASRAQRRMLEAMYATCAHPHCTIGFSACRIHHIVWFTNGGETVLPNLVPLCETHHHLVHEGGWNLSIDTRRHITWTRPDGTRWHTDHGPNRTIPRTNPADAHPPDPPRRPPDPRHPRPADQRKRTSSRTPTPQPTLL
ncbi:MAG: HNH endonuclease signature motif containing protein [Ilumatobacteraceae bacterium]